jgi:hypothetical protein
MEKIDEMLKKSHCKEVAADQQYLKLLPEDLVYFLKSKQI